MSADLPKPDYATPNMRLVGHSDQGGRCDGVQIMVHRGYAYVGHIFSKGFSVIDVRDPSKPQYVKHVAAPHNTWTLHLQAADDLLLVIHNKDMFAQAELADEKNYYKGSVDHHAEEKHAGARLVGGPGGLRCLQSRRAETDRLHAGRRHGPASRLLCRRPLGLRLGAARRFYRLHHDLHRSCRSEEAAARRQILAARHEQGGGRNRQLADQERPLRPASSDRAGRRRLLQLARRLSRRRRRQGQGEPETHHPQDVGARRSAAARTMRCR